MRKLLLCLVVVAVFVPELLRAQRLLSRPGGLALLLGKPSSVAFTYPVTENFNAPGPENPGWVLDAAGGNLPNLAFTTVVIEGTHSMWINQGGGNFASASLPLPSAKTNLHVHFRCYFTNASGGDLHFDLSDSGAMPSALRLQLVPNFLTIYNGSTSAGGAIDFQPFIRTNYFWLEYQAGTGANGITSVWWSTNTTKVNGPFSVTTGTATAPVNTLTIGGFGADAWATDHVLVNTNAYGNNP